MRPFPSSGWHRTTLQVAVWCMCLVGVQARAAEISLVIEGDSEYQILVEEDSPESVTEAASELQRLVEKATGARLEIVHRARRSGKYIALGQTELAADTDLQALPHDGFLLRVSGDNLVLAGRDEEPLDGTGPNSTRITTATAGQFYNVRRWHKSLSAGTYNAVIELARRYLGARWYMPGPLGEEVAQVVRLAIPADLDERVVPHFGMRRFDFVDYNEGLARRALAGEDDGFDQELWQLSSHWGRHLRHTNDIVLANGHGWRLWIPADQYSAKWIAEAIGLPLYGALNPEYFALVHGQRQVAFTSRAQHGGQLCVANPGLRRQYADNIIRYARLNPSTRMFSLSQNDGGMHCECDLCAAWDPPGTGFTVGDVESAWLTDRIVRFQNDVAERVLAQIPDAQFTATAYHATGKAPRVERAHPRLHVIGYYNYLPYRFYIEPKRRELEAALAGWERGSDNFYFGSFYFAYGNYSLPWSTVETHRWMVDMMERHGHRGITMYYSGEDMRPMVGQLGPDPWVLSQLLWDPDQSVDDLVEEWYTGSFGSQAGTLVRAYYGVIAAAMAEEIPRFPDFWANRSFSQRQINLNVYPRVRQECASLIARARAAVVAGEERYRWRVEQVARAWDYVELTLDALEAARLSRVTPTDSTLGRAMDLARLREAFIQDRDNGLAVAPATIALSDRQGPLGLMTELPAGILPRVAVPLIPSAPRIGGGMDDARWARGVKITGMRHNETMEPASVSTEVTVLASPEGLHVRARCEEPLMDQLIVAADASHVWEGDVFELFVVPSGGDGGFYQFLVNADGAGLPLAHRGDTGRDSTWQPVWRRAGARDRGGWTVEVTVPWEALDIPQPPGAGDVWLVDFFRERYTGSPENSAWAPTGGLFAQPHLFGRMVFVEAVGE